MARSRLLHLIATGTPRSPVVQARSARPGSSWSSDKRAGSGHASSPAGEILAGRVGGGAHTGRPIRITALWQHSHQALASSAHLPSETNRHHTHRSDLDRIWP